MKVDKETAEALLAALTPELQDVAKKSGEVLKTELVKKWGEDMKGLATKDDFAEAQKMIEKANEDMVAKMTKMSSEFAEMIKKATEQAKKEESFEDVLKSQLDVYKKEGKLDQLKRHEIQGLTFEFKAAGITATIGLGGNSASVSESMSDASILRLGDGNIYDQQRGLPFILNFVSVGSTNQSTIIWFDEEDKEGDFEIVAEGGLKPLVQYIYTKKSADYQKAAGRAIITDEFEMDFPRLVSKIRQLMVQDVTLEMTDIIVQFMIDNASPYAYSGLDASVEDPDNYGAIGAAIAQLQELFFTPNILMLNVADAWKMRLLKDNEGRYLAPPFQWNGQNYEFGTVVVDPRIPAGHFFVGDAKAMNVDLRGDVQVRIGYGASTDDFNKNQYTMIVERYFFTYMSTNKKAGFIYADFDTIKADISTGEI